MPLLDIPESNRPGILLMGTLSDDVFAEAIEQLGRKPRRVPQLTGVSPHDSRQIFEAVRTMYRVRLNADVPVKDFVGDVIDALEEYGLIRDKDEVLRQRLERILQIEAANVDTKAFLLRYEHENRYCTARILTDARPVFASDVSAAPQAMIINHVLRITYHQDEESTKEIYFALRPDDLTELRGLIDRAEEKEKSVRAMFKQMEVRVLDGPEE